MFSLAGIRPLPVTRQGGARARLRDARRRAARPTERRRPRGTRAPTPALSCATCGSSSTTARAPAPWRCAGCRSTCRRGETVALLGRNGAGKSTLLRTAAGVLTADRGRCARAGEVALLLQTPSDYLLHERVGDELPRAAARRGAARAGARGRRRSATRATCRAARASAWRSASCWRAAGSAAGTRRRCRAGRADARHGPGAQARARRAPRASWRRPAPRCWSPRTTSSSRPGPRAAACCSGGAAWWPTARPREVLSGGRYFTTEVARVLGPEPRIVLPEEGASMLAQARAVAGARPRCPRELAGRQRAASSPWPLWAGILWYESRRPEREAGRAGGRAGRARGRRRACCSRRCRTCRARPTSRCCRATCSGPRPASWSARSPRSPRTSSSARGRGRRGRWSGGARPGCGGALLASARGAAAAAAGRWRSAAALAGLAFGAWMDLFTLTSFAAETSTDGYIAIATLSLPFNVAHAIGNFALCLAFGPAFVRMLERFSRRLHVRWAPARRGLARGAATITTLLALSLVLGASTVAIAAPRSVRDGVRYLERAQNADGGFGGAPRPGVEPAGHRMGRARVSRRRAATRSTCAAAAARRSTSSARASARCRRRASWSARSSRCGAPASTRGASAGATCSPTARAQAPAGRLVLGPVELDRVRDHGAARERALRAARRPCGAPPRGSRASRTTTAASRIATRGGGSFVDETGAALQGLAAAGRRGGRVVAPRARVPARRAEPGRRLRPVRGLALQRAVDGVGGAGDRRGRPRAGLLPPRRPLAARVPGLAPAGRRQLPLLALEHADAGLGDGTGDRRARNARRSRCESRARKRASASRNAPSPRQSRENPRLRAARPSAQRPRAADRSRQHRPPHRRAPGRSTPGRRPRRTAERPTDAALAAAALHWRGVGRSVAARRLVGARRCGSARETRDGQRLRETGARRAQPQVTVTA